MDRNLISFQNVSSGYDLPGVVGSGQRLSAGPRPQAGREATSQYYSIFDNTQLKPILCCIYRLRQFAGDFS